MHEPIAPRTIELSQDAEFLHAVAHFASINRMLPAGTTATVTINMGQVRNGLAWVNVEYSVDAAGDIDRGQFAISFDDVAVVLSPASRSTS